jgi:hypothetical protein
VAAGKGGSAGQIAVKRLQGSPRNVYHLGARVFQPAGAEAVRLRFSAELPAKTLTVLEPAAETMATRSTGAPAPR